MMTYSVIDGTATVELETTSNTLGTLGLPGDVRSKMCPRGKEKKIVVMMSYH